MQKPGIAEDFKFSHSDNDATASDASAVELELCARISLSCGGFNLMSARSRGRQGKCSDWHFDAGQIDKQNM